MAFQGLFIGLDKYESSQISWLSCAARDAKAMHAIFADNLGTGELLTNEAATRPHLLAAFERLNSAQADDLVVLYYSGHGTETQELVTFDADPARMRETSISLDDLLKVITGLTAKKVLLVIDCCFSGAIGAKCLSSEHRTKTISSAEETLKKMSGEGRIIITASSANQFAWESGRYGHGFLTYHLIEGLKGPDELVESGRIPFYRLMEYVSSNVDASAQGIGKEQHPNARWAIDRAFYLPVFAIGTTYAAAFPEYSAVPITTELSSLACKGFPMPLIDSWRESVPSLNPLQVDAVNDYGILDGIHVVVSAPTSSGKTMIGELAALAGLLRGKRAVFLFPLKAIVSDKHKHFNKVYGGFGYRTIRATGDSTDEISLLMRGQYDICLLTYEMFAGLAITQPHILEQIGTVVIDEVQMITDFSRGANLEFVLTFLRLKRRVGIEPQMIALSAVIGDTNGFEHWLDARLLKREERPVPINEGIIDGHGTFRFRTEKGDEGSVSNFVRHEPRKGSSQDWIIPLVRKLVSEGKQVIVFRETTGEARGTANYLADNLDLPPATHALASLPTGDSTLESTALRKCLEGGVALHTANLDRDERLAVEENFRRPNSAIRVIAATTTLAMGVNTPTEAVVIAGLQHPGPTPYSVAEYKNMVGRAGRLGYAESGASYLLATTPKEAHSFWTDYVLGTPEDMHSRFLDSRTDPRSLIIRVLVTAKRSTGRSGIAGLDAGDILDFLEGSFGAFRRKIENENWNWDRQGFQAALSELEARQLIISEDGKCRLSKLGWIAAHGTIEVESVIRLVHVLQYLTPASLNDPALIAAAQITVEMDEVYFRVNGNGSKETDTWRSELRRQGVPEDQISSLLRSSDAKITASRLKKAVSCLLWVSRLSFEDIERVLTTHGGRFDGVSGAVRRTAERTRGLMTTIGAIASYLHPDLELSERLSNLVIRIETGTPPEISELASLLGPRLSRSDYRLLIESGINNVEATKIAGESRLRDILSEEKSEMVWKFVSDILDRSHQDPEFPLIPLYDA